MQKKVEGRLIPADIGLRLRKMRKGKNITLQELAVTTGFSIGKLSNIERGGKLSMQDLEIICLHLEINLEQLLMNQSNKDIVNKMRAEIELVLAHISMSLFMVAETLLNGIDEKIETLDLYELLPDTHFARGVYYLKRNNVIKAKTYLKKVINSKTGSENITVRALNALSALEFLQGNIISAIHYNEFAEEKCQGENVNSEERMNTFFNGGVLNLHINRLDHTLKYCILLEEVAVGKMSYLGKYLRGIVAYLKNQPIVAANLISNCIVNFRKERDTENLLLGLIALYVIYMSDSKQFQPNIPVIEGVLSDEFLCKPSDPVTHQRILSFIQHWIALLLEERNLECAEKLLGYCEREEGNEAPGKYKTLYLWSVYFRNKQDREKELEYLERALLALEDEDSMERAMILAELGFAQNDRGNYFEAIRIFYEQNKKLFITPHQFLIPELRYL